MSEKIQITRQVYRKDIYKNVIDTNFSQLIQPVTQIEEDSISINEFFQAYDDLFFEIPKTGDINSHQYLINKSSQYVGDEFVNPLIAELQAEITSLRQQILSSNNVINDLTDQLSTLGNQFKNINEQSTSTSLTNTQ
jgi:seryl-tRNA synthetase